MRRREGRGRDHATTRRALALLVVGTGITFGLAACGSRTGGGAVSAEGGETGSGAAPYVTADSRAEGTGTTRPTGGTNDTGARNGSGTGPEHSVGDQAVPTPGPGPAAQPARPGVYEYDTRGESKTSGAVNRTRELPKVTTLRVDAADAGRQMSVRDLRDRDGDGTVTTTVLEYRHDGVYLEELTVEATAMGLMLTYEFAPTPPQLVFPTDAGVGYETSFSLTSKDDRVVVEVDIEVLREEMLTFAGVDVATFLVRTHSIATGDVRSETTSENSISRERSLTVREQVVSDAEFGLTHTHTEYTAVLRGLDAGPPPGTAV